MKDKNQLSLFEPYKGQAPRVRGSDTSAVAGDSMQEHLSRLQAQVFEAVRSAKEQGLICDEVEELLVLKHQTASARLRELVLKGLIVDSGQRRLTRSRRPAVIYVVKP